MQVPSKRARRPRRSNATKSFAALKDDVEADDAGDDEEFVDAQAAPLRRSRSSQRSANDGHDDADADGGGGDDDESLMSVASASSVATNNTEDGADNSRRRGSTRGKQPRSKTTSGSSNSGGGGKRRVRADKVGSSSIGRRVLENVTSTSAVSLDKAVLQAFSITDFELYFERLTALRNLTPAEQREVQRQRRLLKNRQSAQSSRQKRKAYIDSLETKLGSLKTTNRRLTVQCNKLKAKVTSLAKAVGGDVGSGAMLFVQELDNKSVSKFL